MNVLCEKIGPMQWRIVAPGREPFHYWSYALAHDGEEYTKTFECEVDPSAISEEQK